MSSSGAGRTTAACAALLGCAVSAAAGDVVIVRGPEPPGWRAAAAALKRGLPDRTVEDVSVGTDAEAARQMFAQLETRGATVVLVGQLGAQLLPHAPKSLRMLFAMVEPPLPAGLEGLPGVVSELPLRNQLATFRAIHPRLSRLGVLVGPATPQAFLDEIQKVSLGLRMLIVARRMGSEDEARGIMREMLKGDAAVDALFVPDDSLLSPKARRLVLGECEDARKPVFATSDALVVEGALASNGAVLASVGEQLAELILRLESGEPSTDIGVYVPKGEVVVNTRTAADLGITVPADVLRGARQVP